MRSVRGARIVPSAFVLMEPEVPMEPLLPMLLEPVEPVPMPLEPVVPVPMLLLEPVEPVPMPLVPVLPVEPLPMVLLLVPWFIELPLGVLPWLAVDGLVLVLAGPVELLLLPALPAWAHATPAVRAAQAATTALKRLIDEFMKYLQMVGEVRRPSPMRC